MTDLTHKSCVPCKGGVPPLKGTVLQELFAQLKGWNLEGEHHLEKNFIFKNFKEALAFTNRVGELAEREGHHPDIYLAWGKVGLKIWTHKIDGLTESDFILAAKLDLCVHKKESTRKYHHYGIPTKEKRPNESYVEAGDFKFYTTPFEANKWHIQWHRFPKDHGLPELVAKVPHIAFQIEDLDAEIKGCKVLFGPYSPLKGYRVAMIEEQGIPIELVETSLSDEELASLEEEKLGQTL